MTPVTAVRFTTVMRSVCSVPMTARVALTQLLAEHPLVAAVSVNDVGAIDRQYALWQALLPSVNCFYAIKCNPDTVLVQHLAQLRSGFDCASADEMESAIAAGAPAHRLILAHPCKSVADLQAARRLGVARMTFDSVDELHKVARFYPDAQLVLRLLPDDSYSKMRFGTKFGAPLENVPDLLQVARQLKLRVVGTSFHVGSACQDPIAYDKALALSRHVWDMAAAVDPSNKMSVLNIGGGLPSDATQLARFGAQIEKSLELHFPRSKREKDILIMGEPGRCLATPFSTLYTCVRGKKPMDATGQHQALFLGDGVYGSFNCIMFDHAEPKPFEVICAASVVPTPSRVVPSPLAGLSNWVRRWVDGRNTSQRPLALRAHYTRATAPASKTSMTATLFGPTCDSIDVVCKGISMPEAHVGDWIGFRDMGGYTGAAATRFNGIPLAHQVYIRS